MTSVIQRLPEIRAYDWRVPVHGVEPPDLDAVYQRYFAESRLPELLDRMVELLASILSSEEVDSNRTIAQLQELLELLKRTRKRGGGNLLSLFWNLQFARNAITKTFVGGVTDIPVIGGALGGFLQAANDAIVEADIVQAQVHQDLSAKAGTHVALVEVRPMALPAPEIERTVKIRESLPWRPLLLGTALLGALVARMWWAAGHSPRPPGIVAAWHPADLTDEQLQDLIEAEAKVPGADGTEALNRKDG